MHNWDKVRDRLNNENADSDKKASIIKSLHQIVDKAEAWELDPMNAENASFSNLTEIIVEAKKAIRSLNKPRLEELFALAAKCTNTQLRLKLRSYEWDVVEVERKYDGVMSYVVITLSEEQYQRIKNAAVRVVRFVEKESSE